MEHREWGAIGDMQLERVDKWEPDKAGPLQGAEI